MSKKLYLIFHGRFPSEKAAALFAAKSAAAFAQQGFDVTLVVPARKGIIKDDPYVFYSIEKNFTIKYLHTIDIYNVPVLNRFAFWTSFLAFSTSVYFFMMKHAGKQDVMYSNESLPLFLLSWDFKNCFYEMHDFPESKIAFFGKFLSRMKWILIHNKWKLEEAKRLFPKIPEARFLYEPNAVDIKAFDIPISKEDARKKLSLSTSKKIAVYTGHLYGWKGVDTLAQAAKLLPDDYQVIFVGGTQVDVEAFSQKYQSPAVSILGFKPHDEIPLWQKAADVLVLPNTAKEKISAYYTSPMKLYEYMASKRPIVASSIPSIREIVDEYSAYLVIPDDPQVLAQAIRDVATSTTKYDSLAQNAYKKVLDHTWNKRAARIVSYMHI